jgi:hypothetical protein
VREVNARWEKWVLWLLLITMLYICAQTIGMAIRAPGTISMEEKVGTVDIQNAQEYADWCGGFVQVVRGDIAVQGCDR